MLECTRTPWPGQARGRRRQLYLLWPYCTYVPWQAAAAAVKKLLPALLIGPEGAFDGFATSFALLPKPQDSTQEASKASRKKPRTK